MFFFWISEVYNFCIKAFYNPGKNNIEVDHMPRLHESAHFLAYCQLLTAHGVDILTLTACCHKTPLLLCVLIGPSFVFLSGATSFVVSLEQEEEILYYCQHTYATKTRKSYKTHCNAYCSFRYLFHLPLFPASTNTLSMYPA